jgi:hypothetical protein
MTVDVAGKIHSSKDDGDMHFSGRADEVGLPFVAEIMNAKGQMKAVKAVRNAAGKDAIPIKGAWRLWCEHAGDVNQKQGATFAAADTSNPDHVFEIHPVTEVAGIDVLASIGPIEGYTYKKAHDAFTHYENVGCKITPNGDTVTIKTAMAGYNMPEFILESVDDQKGGLAVEDGRFLFAKVLDLDGDVLVSKVRMAFIKGTEAEFEARNLTKGQRMRVVALPRISLTLIHWRVEHAKDDRDPLNWNVPYEMIVVGVTDN